MLATAAVLRKSCCRVGSFGLSCCVKVFRPDSTPPKSLPCPRNPSANAPSVPFNSTGSIFCSNPINDWNSVLTSSETAVTARCAPGRIAAADGVLGGMNSTDLAPKTVLLAMWTAALDGT